MRKLLIVMFVALALGLSGCMDQPSAPDDTGLNNSTDNQTDAENSGGMDDVSTGDDGNGTSGDGNASDEEDGDEEPVSDAVLERVDGEGYTEFHGTGTASTDTVSIDEGLARISVENVDPGEETGVFNLRLVDFEGEVVENVVTSRGNWSGAAMVHLRSGSYAFEVESIGNWTVRMESSLDESGGRPDIEHRGSHSEVFGPFDYERTVEVTLEVRDDEHAVVDLYGPEGRFDSMLNLVGPAEDSMVYSDSRLHYVHVDTDSEDWSIEVRATE